jgi:DNA polymerase III alpha subunit
MTVPLVATGNANYLEPEDALLDDVLTCNRHRIPLTQATTCCYSNREYFLQSP